MFQRYLNLPKEAYIVTLASAVNHIGNVTTPFLTLILSVRLGFSIELTATLISAKTVLQLVGVAIGGIASDRYSRKTVLRWGGFLAVSTYALMAFNTHRLMLVLGMLAVNSLAQAAIDPAIEALLMDVIPQEHQRDTAAMKYFGLNVGFTIGPLLAAALYKSSLPILFLVDGGTLLIALLLIHYKIEETYRKSNKKQHVKLFDLFANRSLMGFSVAVMLVFVVFFQYNFGLPLAVKEVLPSNGDWLYGSLMSLNAIVVVLFTFLLNHLLRNLKIKTVLLLGVVFYALGFGMYGFANGAVLFLIGTFLWSIGEILVSTGVNPMIYELAEPSKRGKASALFPLLRRFAAFTSPLAGGWIVANLGFTSLWIFCVLILGIAALFIEFSLTS